MSVLVKIVPHDRSKKMAIKIYTVQEVVEKAITKLNLVEGNYQVVLEEDGTVVDEDEILLDLAKSAVSTLTLMLVPEGQNWTLAAAEKISKPTTTTTDVQAKPNTPQPSTNVPLFAHEPNTASDRNLWQRFPQRLIKSCEKQEHVRDDDRRAMVAAIADYMLQDLKDPSRKTAERIARRIFEKYSKSFSDVIDDEIIGSGMESLRSQIYTAVHNRKMNRQDNKRPIESGSEGSEDEGSSVSSVSRKQDEYGCVEYQPLLPPGETKATQEDKRLELLKFYQVTPEADTEEIQQLLDDTYTTQRILINNKSRNIVKIFIDWPFFKSRRALIQHASRLLGKPVLETWKESLDEKTKSILKYFKSLEMIQKYKTKKLKKNTADQVPEENYVLTMLRLAKSYASLTVRSEAPYFAVVFPLLVHHMKENKDLLFMVVDDTLTTQEMIVKPLGLTPVLVIRGKSFFDENAKYDVVLEQSITIPVNDLLQGVLITFLAYYIFGYAYPKGLCSTLEFIQRVILRINPVKGDKREVKKRRERSYDPKVLKLTKELNIFTEKF